MVQKQAHGLWDLFHAVVAVGDELFRLDPAAGDELGHAAQEEPSAAATHPLDGLVPVAEAPHGGLDGDGGVAEVGAQVYQGAAVFQHLQPQAQLLLAAAAQDHVVHRPAVFPDNLVDKTDPFLTFFRKILQLVADTVLVPYLTVSLLWT